MIQKNKMNKRNCIQHRKWMKRVNVSIVVEKVVCRFTGVEE